MEYRYMIWNDVQKCFQFPSICETTEKGAMTCLFKKIGNDARKYRFEIKKVEKEEAYKIRQNLKDEMKAKRIKHELENFTLPEILKLIKENKKRSERV